MSQSLCANYQHLVFSTKDRYPYFSDKKHLNEICSYIAGITKTLKIHPIEIGGHHDHLHVLVDIGKSITIADFVKEVKRVSSIWIKERFKDENMMAKFTWQGGYGSFSVSKSNLDQVIQYIQNQERHHKKVSFMDEYRMLLDKHQIKYDEKYLWT